MHPTYYRVFVFAALVGLASCSRGGDEAEANESDEPSAGDRAPETAVENCSPVEAVRTIQGVQLRDAEGACAVFLPANIAPGTYQVRVSVADDSASAAVELATDDGRLFATTGVVTVDSVDGGRIVGSVDAADEADPNLGPIAGAFDVPAP